MGEKIRKEVIGEVRLHLSFPSRCYSIIAKRQVT